MIYNSQKATRAHTRAHNKRLVLKTIYDRDSISRAEVSRVTSLTRATVSNVVAELIEDGLISNAGIATKTIGKPPTMLTVNADAHHILTLDLAGTAFTGCILDLRGSVRHQETQELGDSTGEDALARVFTLTDRLVEASERPILGIGVGTPGLVDPKRGITNALNLDWVDLPLAEKLESRYDVPAYLANDAQVSALAQYLFGPQSEARNLILVKVGRGIGAGIVLDGEIFFGDGYGAGEIGHVVVAPEGRLCTCGHFGCLETMAGSKALADNVALLAGSNPTHMLHGLLKERGSLTAEAILDAFQAGEKSIEAVVERSGKYLGMAIAHLIGALNLRHIYLAGTMSRFEESLLEPIRAEVLRRSLPNLATHLEIRTSELGDNIVSLGAGALVLHHQLGLV